MRIRLTVGDRVLTATLRDNESTRDFISLLPMALTLNDYAGTEKISDLPKRLSTKDAPPAVILLLEISRIMPPGGIWRYSIGISGTQTDL